MAPAEGALQAEDPSKGGEERKCYLVTRMPGCHRDKSGSDIVLGVGARLSAGVHASE